jgi:5-methylcytosine-specific restriction enzyme A
MSRKRPASLKRECKAARLANTQADDCQKERERFYNREPWVSLRRAHITKYPLCAECHRQGRLKAASHVDHIVPRRQAPRLAYDPSNLQSLCASCHSKKTAAERGGRA